jgi:hypothetical protein
MKRLPLPLIVVLCLAWAQSARAQSNITNASLETRAAGELSRTFQELVAGAGPFWIGYAVPAQNPDWNSCCWNNSPEGHAGCCGRCSIEATSGDSHTIGTDRRHGRIVELEGGEVVVLLRVADRQVERVRAFSADCEVDAGGRRVVWLTGVQPAASVTLLSGLADSRPPQAGKDKDKVRSGAIMAISAHDGPESTDALIRLAKDHASGRARADALFWLAQKAGLKAAGTITHAIENDPDTKVKERAVFALSQLPGNEGVPKLIDVARTNRNPRVRQQAMFWLGQSKDPRALKFFEEVLLK